MQVQIINYKRDNIIEYKNNYFHNKFTIRKKQ